MLNEAICNETEYKTLVSAWDSINHPNRQDSTSQLFTNYLNHIWAESQNMLQCAQYWQTVQSDVLGFSDAVQTMNSLGLHLMKRSLQARQDLMNITQYVESDDKDSFYSASPYTKNESVTETFYKNSSGSIRDMNMDQPLNESKSLIRLMRSPSAPTQTCSETYYSFQDILPACHNNDFFSENPSDKCQFCKDHSHLKKSYSFEDFQANLDDMYSDDDLELFVDDDKHIAEESELSRLNTLSENDGHTLHRNDNNIPCNNVSDVSTLSLTSPSKREVMTDESEPCITPLFEESNYLTDASLPEKLQSEITDMNLQKTSPSGYRMISSTILQPVWTLKLVLKKRSKKAETSDEMQTRIKKIISKFQFKK